MPITKRRLTDLFVVGRELVFDDGQGDPVVLWLQKMTSLEHQETARRSDAARARIFAMVRDKNSDEAKALDNAVRDLGPKEQLVEFLLFEERQKVHEASEAELADDEEWSKDNYLQGLRDSWYGINDFKDERSLKDTYAVDPEHPEAKRAFEELKRFAEKAAEMADPQVAEIRSGYQAQSVDELVERGVQRLLDLRGSQEWLETFYRWRAFYETRTPENHRERYFTDVHEVQALSDEVWSKLSAAIIDLHVDPQEGKDLPPTPSSTEPSEPVAVVVSQDSGLPASPASMTLQPI